MTTDLRGFDRPMLMLGLIGAMLAAVNNVVATVGLGIAQGPVVAFTTPLAFALARLGARRLPAATLVYLPVVIVSIFTLNFGPPGYYKIGFMSGALAYDALCYLTGVGWTARQRVRLWKLLLANISYPIGLLAGGMLILTQVTVEIPILARGLPAAIGMVVLFALIGSLATWLAHRIFYRRIVHEL